MLSLDRILIPDLVVTDLFMYSLSGMILLYLGALFCTKGEISLLCVCMYAYVCMYVSTILCKNTFSVKEVWPNKVESYLKGNA